MAPIARTELSVGGTHTVLYRGGGGPPLVLLHGGGIDSARLTWAPLWDGFAAEAEVFAPDLPGYGDSPLGEVAATLSGYRRWLIELLNAVGAERAVLVGLSLGGGVALRTALDAAPRVAGLVLCAPYGVSPQIPGGRWGYLIVHTPGVNAVSWALVRSSDAMARRTLGSLLWRTTPSPELVREVRAVASNPDAARAWSAFQHHEVTWIGPRTYFDGLLATVHQPAMLLSGDHDRLVPPHDVRAAADQLPNGEFVAVPDAGHWLPRDAPEAIWEAVANAITSFGRGGVRRPALTDERADRPDVPPDAAP